MTADAAAEWTPLCAPMRVAVDAAQAARYAREIGADPSAAPLSFPAVWLAQPVLRAAIAQICEEADAVPVHEAQRFQYAAPLTLGAHYELAVALRREEKPPRLVLQATVTTPEGAPVGRCETTLRIVPRAGLPKKDAA
jgi:hypothetical protein